MDTYIDRLYQERSELRDRIIKLEGFMVSDKLAEASTIQLSIINIQHAAMSAYLECLNERVNWIQIQGSKAGKTA